MGSLSLRTFHLKEVFSGFLAADAKLLVKWSKARLPGKGVANHIFEQSAGLSSIHIHPLETRDLETICERDLSTDS